MCCFDQRTGFAASFAGIVLCALLSVVGVVLPGWTVRETVGQTVYAGLFWTCSVNGTLSKSGCLVGNPFEDSALDVTTKFLLINGAWFQIVGVFFAVYHNLCGDSSWRRHSALAVTSVIGGGLVSFTGSICGVAFVLLDGKGEYSNGPALFLAMTSSTLSISFASLLSIFNRQAVYDDIIYV